MTIQSHIAIDQNFIYLKIDGKEIKILLTSVSKKPSTANDLQRNLFTISPSGYGIHWPLLDEDHSISSLLKVA